MVPNLLPSTNTLHTLKNSCGINIFALLAIYLLTKLPKAVGRTNVIFAWRHPAQSRPYLHSHSLCNTAGISPPSLSLSPPKFHLPTCATAALCFLQNFTHNWVARLPVKQKSLSISGKHILEQATIWIRSSGNYGRGESDEPHPAKPSRHLQVCYWMTKWCESIKLISSLRCLPPYFLGRIWVPSGESHTCWYSRLQMSMFWTAACEHLEFRMCGMPSFWACLQVWFMGAKCKRSSESTRLRRKAG